VLFRRSALQPEGGWLTRFDGRGQFNLKLQERRAAVDGFVRGEKPIALASQLTLV
jgi:hypothetical protein